MKDRLKKRARNQRNYAAHREARLAYAREYYVAHRDERRAYKAANRDRDRAADSAPHRVAAHLAAARKRKYGATPEWVEEMLDAQGGQCAICSRSIGLNASVDHNHITGELRALLCRPCNARIGEMEDPTWLDSALSYLEVHAA